jgi:hypothetical protein
MNPALRVTADILSDLLKVIARAGSVKLGVG